AIRAGTAGGRRAGLVAPFATAGPASPTRGTPPALLRAMGRSSGARPPRSEAGGALLEVMVGAVVVGISAIGVSLMFSLGQTFVVNQGAERAALYLTQQKIEKLTGVGFDALTVGAASLVSGCPSGEPCYTETLQAGAEGAQSFARTTTV